LPAESFYGTKNGYGDFASILSMRRSAAPSFFIKTHGLTLYRPLPSQNDLKLEPRRWGGELQPPPTRRIKEPDKERALKSRPHKTLPESIENDLKNGKAENNSALPMDSIKFSRLIDS
jgi:hypothetical protein